MSDTNSAQTNTGNTATMDKDGAYVSDVQAAILLQSPRGGRLILYVIALLAISALAWSWYAEIDEVIKGQGKVVPSSRVQKIQNLEGGILKEVLVSEGQVVEKDTPLLILDDVQFSGEYHKNALEAIRAQAAIERLNAEALGKELFFSEELVTRYPELVQQQSNLAKSRGDNLQNQIDVLQLTKKEKQAILEQLKQKLANAKNKLSLAQEELAKLRPLLKSGAVSEMEILRSRQSVAEAKSEMDNAMLAIPETKTIILEAQERLDQAVSDFRQKAREEMDEMMSKSKALLAVQKSLEDRVDRTIIKSPVHGTVKKNYVDTIGGTIRPGMTMMEIVPLDDKLLIETKIPPKDIGFIRHNQKAKVKLSAYDFAVYGGLEGTVERVSADSITDDKGRTFFVVNINIPHNYVGDKIDKLHIIPGMQAEVDVVVTRRKIIDYVLRPLLKSKYN
ncbi:HlyD family type I secretion periplasmic adaptor subunit [Desulforhopalus sp. 52FAK]